MDALNRSQIEQAEFIKNKFSTYLKSTFGIRDKEYNDLFISRLNELESRLYRGPFLASALPFEQSQSIKSLMDDGLFEKDFERIGDIDFDRPSYEHQVKAFQRIKQGSNVVVTTGTGSGKTECFMLPIIDELIKEYNSGNRAPGVRAIFLFPLNALVYDQIDRLRKYLSNYKEIRFGFYTGRTPEDENSREGKRLIAQYKNKYGEPIENEVLTREKMRENPPQILFTNYSMLEYLLIRPTDQSLISTEALKYLRFVVLDEAHIYRGALGIEISLLLRRLSGTANKKIQYILTSATLGRGQEDLDDIISFASKLTSSVFEKEDVIFGIRHNFEQKVDYSINPEDYTKLLSNIDNNAELTKIYNKYSEYNNEKSIGVNLYNLLSRDSNTRTLYHKTKNVGEFSDVVKSMDGFSYETLSNLIELINKSFSKDDKYSLKLFDVKYHMFMKAPDGAFITIGNKKEFSLLTANQINDYKAFKIGICQNCKVPYIMGITENNILCIDDEIDIDESYADKARRLEYYLIADTLNNEEIEDIEENIDFEKYYICSKCGYIRKASSAISANDCDHFESNKTVLYKYIGKDDKDLDDEDIVTNNIHKCPICEYKSNNSGVVMGFHVGKDRATTLISQILYESMNYPKIIEASNKNSLFKTIPVVRNGRKQFLAFSDSRQQAAFFSKFLNQNNDRFLKKTLMWDILKERNHEEISYLSLIEKLENKFRNDYQYTEENAIKHAKVTALWELLSVDGRNSGEGVGLFAFKLNYQGTNFVDDEVLENALKSKGFDNVSAQEFRDTMSQLFNIFRVNPSIDYGALDCESIEEKKELLGYRQRKAYVKEQDTKGAKPNYYPVKSFLPVVDEETKKSSRNNAVKYVMKTYGYEQQKAKDFLKLIFETAIDEKILVKNTEAPEYEDTYLIKANKYDLYSYKKIKFYKCDKCNKLTLYNVKNKCTTAECEGELRECDVDNDEYYKNNYYRNEYINRPAEHLICREHTAQLNASEAKEIQDDFKNENGKTNFISCSTTFEMGIDLGSLNTIFMRNVPPTPSNYAQRAGRAGRRSETSAFVLTFCSASSHDYTYFINPQEMIRGLVKPPYFVLDNDKIIMRHITATALSLFFKEDEYKQYFTSIEEYLSEDVTTKFLNYIKSYPKKLGEVIDKYLLVDENLLNKYGNFRWINYIEMSESSMNKMVEGMQGLISLYKEAEAFAASQRDYSSSKSYKAALERLNTPNSLITYFTKYNVIPGYGFPVDNVDLYIYDYEKDEMNESYNLSRNLSMAISEYAPGSEIIVDEKKYTSRYMFLPYNGYPLPTTYYCECEKCHTINTNVDKNYFISGVKCKYCDTPLNVSGINVKKYMTPIYGFVADKLNRDTRRIKPFKTYASDIYYIGENLTISDELNDVVTVTEHKNEELLVLNESRFFYCPNCGYTSLNKRNQLPTMSQEHREYKGKTCKCGDKLYLTHLGHSYRTDIIQISFKNIDRMHDEDTAISLLFAILEGISMTYCIERNDIGGIIYSSNISKPYSLILFDTVSGGAGHVKRLKDDASLYEVLKNSLKKVSQDCCDEDASCYNCLRTYNNQKLHKHIKRGLAKKALIEIIDKINSNKRQYTVSNPSISFNTINIRDFIKNGIMDGNISKEYFESLLNELDLQNCSYPDGYGYKIVDVKDNSIQYCDFLWKRHKVMLFTIDNLKSYEKLLNTQNKYECYLLTDSFDYVEFVRKLKGE